jgi:xanthine dehydrogenase YagS FAD-binding subunit
LREAVRQLAMPGTRVCAGGTDLIDGWHDVSDATTLVSLSEIAELKGVSERDDDGWLRIGALATLAQVSWHRAIRERWPALSKAAETATNLELRNQATIGGNLCQRPRCFYFRGDFNCLRTGGDACYAERGENDLHAIFGGSPCFMVHPSDTAPALVALEAQARVAGPSGDRTVPLDSFFVLPSQDATRETVLGPGEILTEILVPPPAAGAKSTYQDVRVREAWEFALVGAAVAVATSDGVVSRARVVLSGVAPVPWRARSAESALLGQSLGPASAAAAGAAAAEGAAPLDHNSYKVDLVRGLVGAALLELQ